MQTPGVTEIARKVILTMSRQGISLTPENYRVWYEYVTGSREELSLEMQNLLKGDPPLSDAICRDLYDRHFGAAAQQALLERFTRESSRILHESLQQAASTGHATTEYASQLSDFLSKLEHGRQEAAAPSGPLEELVLAAMVKTMIRDSQRMERSVSELKDQLERAERETETLREQLVTVGRQVNQDCLTGLYNRRYFDERMAALLQEFQEGGEPFSLILMDIDLFKQINDTHGHLVGDSVLEFLGKTIKGAVKGRDVPARCGGDEFAILLPMTVCGNARALAENLRREIGARSLKVKNTNERIGAIGVSVGVAQVRPGESAAAFLDRADQALYLAKGCGRDRVKTEEDLPPEARACG
jgi:diguanylate cyclase